jgi:hypothetical protein
MFTWPSSGWLGPLSTVYRCVSDTDRSSFSSLLFPFFFLLICVPSGGPGRCGGNPVRVRFRLLSNRPNREGSSMEPDGPAPHFQLFQPNCFVVRCMMLRSRGCKREQWNRFYGNFPSGEVVFPDAEIFEIDTGCMVGVRDSCNCRFPTTVMSPPHTSRPVR